MNIIIKEVLASHNKENVFNSIAKKYSFRLQIFIDFQIENIRYILILNENMVEKDNFLFDCALQIDQVDNTILQIKKPKNNDVCIYVLGLINKSRLNMIDNYENNQKIEFELSLT
jgi:hypothetical protein